MVKNKNKLILQGLVACAGTDCSVCHLLKTAEQIFFWLLSIAFATTVLFVLIAGFAYILSVSNFSLANRAKTALKVTLVGFAICLLAWLAIHSVYAILGFQGSWWSMDCTSDETPSDQGQTTGAQAELYANEVSMNGLGGRNNPIALPDLVLRGTGSFPDNKYFFVHGLGGQPLDQAAQQMAQIVEKEKQQGKIVYAVMPSERDPITGEIINVRLDDLTSLISSDNQGAQNQTGKKLEDWITQYFIESDSVTLPIIVYGGEVPTVPKLSNDVWKQLDNLINNGLISLDSSGTLRVEGGDVSENNPSGNKPSYWNVNLLTDYSKNNSSTPEFIVDPNNPITFNFSPEVSADSAEKAATDIAKTVATAVSEQTTGSSDNWTKLATLMAKESLNGNSYSPGIFPYAVPTNNTTPRSNSDNEELNKILEEKATSIVKQEVDDYFGRSGFSNETNIMFPSVDTGEKSYTIPSSPAGAQASLNQTDVSDNGSPSSLSGVQYFNKVPSLASYSIVQGGINTDQVLPLSGREKLYQLVQGIQKEESDSTGKNSNIPPGFVLCVEQLESKFDVAAGEKGSTHVGLGQMGTNETKGGLQELKKNAPNHYKELFEKVQQDYGVDMEDTYFGKDNAEKKKMRDKIARTDPEFATATTTAWIQKLGEGGKSLQTIAQNFGGEAYPGGETSWILQCTQNNGWRKNQAWVQAALDRKNK